MLSNTTNIFNLLGNSLRLRIQAAFIVFGLVLVIGLGGAAYFLVRTTLVNENFNKLTALRETRSTELDLWFNERRIDIETYSESPFLIAAMRDFDLAIHGDENASVDEASEIRNISYDELRALYLGQSSLADANDGSLYSQVHASYFPVLQDYLITTGYYDMFLVDNDGDIIFSVIKEDDFATNLVTGPYSASNIATAFDYSRNAIDTDFNAFVDFEFYEPSQEAAMFISSPIFDGDERLGTLIFQIPVDILDVIMNERSGLGESGETYLVGSDFLFRNDSRFLDSLDTTSTILNEDFIVNTVGVQSALAGNTGTRVIDDYRGVPVLSSWNAVTIQDEIITLNVEPVRWALMSEIDEQEVLQQINPLLSFIVVLGLIAMIVTVFLAYTLSRPILQLATFARVIQDGDLTQRAPVTSNDEIGQLAAALNRTLDAVANRSRDIEAIVDVSAQAAGILDEDRLLQDVADLTKERFALYHAHIYRLDERGDTLVLKAGAGYIGRQMVAEERIIPLSKRDSIVATTARTRQSNTVNDVTSVEAFLPHPLLPSTRSELAVPLIARGEILGVLDVQSDRVGYFDSNILTVMETLAVQISNAISNVRLIESAQRQSRHAQALSNIQQVMQSANSMDDMLQTTAREIAKALRVPHTMIQLGIERDDLNYTNEEIYNDEVN